MFGTTDGQIIVMSSTGAMVSQVTVHDGMEISAMAWSCERFNMEEVEFTDDNHRTEQGESHALRCLSEVLSWHSSMVLFSVPTSGPQLVYQRLWYVLFCLWKSAYKRSLAAYRKE